MPITNYDPTMQIARGRRRLGWVAGTVVAISVLAGCSTSIDGSPNAAQFVVASDSPTSAYSSSRPTYSSSTPSTPRLPAPADPFSSSWAAREVAGSQSGYGLRVSFSEVGDRVNAIVNYPELQCGGVWLSDRVNGNTVELTEHITYGSCVKDTDVRITDNGITLDVEVTWTGKEIHATLEPTGQIPLYDAPSSTSEASGKKVERAIQTGYGTATYTGTSQWVGCDAPAVTTYDLGGRFTTLLATPAVRDGADRDIAVRFAIQADNRPPQITSARIGEIPRPLEVDVAGARTLTVSATRTSGGCSTSSDAFGVLLGAVLSR